MGGNDDHDRHIILSLLGHGNNVNNVRNANAADIVCNAGIVFVPVHAAKAAIFGPDG